MFFFSLSLSSRQVHDSAAWRDTLAADRVKVQAEWQDVNAARRRWDMEQHQAARDAERTKADAQRRIEAAVQREADAERMKAEVLRQLESARARVRLEVRSECKCHSNRGIVCFSIVVACVALIVSHYCCFCSVHRPRI